ncbi:PPE family protein [Mycolicibacterium iranicum]|uniref:PPE family protein n=1 Tax=Mycolicibacterium iranicum TaxID=912594 RepID=A0ABT4HLX0_MYCIR|nr:PPE family protein [Mycolicibacterium iranicum]MCZ0731211.1 PPE family protein [Mycolicibacterium iranicum]
MFAGIPLPPIWGAFPPEINTSRLQAGAGAVPMLQAAAGWEALAISLETQADELTASLSSLGQMWQGMASERAISAVMPMVLWLRMLALAAQLRAAQASAQASAWTSAATATPQIPEIEQNHVTNAVLHATNFLGVNGIPIALNEADYIRMWNLAASVMGLYQADTSLNTTFPPVPPPKPITVPAGGQGMAMAMGNAVPGAATAFARNATIAKVSTVAKFDTANQVAGRAEGAVHQSAQQAQSQAQQQGQLMQQAPQQGMQMGMQMASQLGSTLGQLPQQMMQGVTQPFQQLTQPLQQMSSLFGQMGGMGNGNGAQVGLLGATPFSNHPAIGGSGAATGAGLIRAASLPGAGGSAPQTPLMSNLVGSGLQSTSPVAVGAGAGPGAGAGLAPVGAGAGMGGGGGPMGMMGQRGKSGGNRPGLNAPAPLDHDLSEDEDDEW